MKRVILALAAVLLVAFALVVSAAPVTLVAQGSVWKCDDTGKDLGTAWRELAFDDSKWVSGPSPIGFGDDFIKTNVTKGVLTYYFRQTIKIDVDPATFTKLTMNAQYDDGMLLFINGREALRKALPAGEIKIDTLATSHSGTKFETIDVTSIKGFLVKGANILAVEMHQTNATSSDIVLNMEIVAE